MRLRVPLVLLLLVLVAVAAALGFAGPFSRRGPAMLVLPGTVEVQEVRLGSKVGGRVAQIYVNESDIVEAGRELVRIDIPEIESRRDQVKARLIAAQAEAERTHNGARPEEKDEAKAALAAADAKLEKLEKGFRDEEKRQAIADLAEAEAEAYRAKEDFQRIAGIANRSGAASKSEFDAAKWNHDRAQERANAARARRDLMVKGFRPEEIAEARGLRDQAQARYDLLRAGARTEDKALADAKVTQLQAELREAEAQAAEAVIRAPSKVSIEVLSVRPGDLLQPNQPAVKVLQADDLWVKVYVPETQLGKVRVGQPAEVLVDSYPGRIFDGKIVQILGVSEFTPRNVQSADERRHQVFAVKVRVVDPGGVFKSGMAAEVRVPLQEVQQ